MVRLLPGLTAHMVHHGADGEAQNATDGAAEGPTEPATDPLAEGHVRY